MSSGSVAPRGHLEQDRVAGQMRVMPVRVCRTYRACTIRSPTGRLDPPDARGVDIEVLPRTSGARLAPSTTEEALELGGAGEELGGVDGGDRGLVEGGDADVEQACVGGGRLASIAVAGKPDRVSDEVDGADADLLRAEEGAWLEGELAEGGRGERTGGVLVDVGVEDAPAPSGVGIAGLDVGEVEGEGFGVTGDGGRGVPHLVGKAAVSAHHPSRVGVAGALFGHGGAEVRHALFVEALGLVPTADVDAPEGDEEGLRGLDAGGLPGVRRAERAIADLGEDPRLGALDADARHHEITHVGEDGPLFGGGLFVGHGGWRIAHARRRRQPHGTAALEKADGARYEGPMSLSGLGKETVEIVNRGAYTLRSGAVVSIEEGVARAIAGTRLFRPGDFDRLSWGPGAGHGACRVEVTGETTGAAGRRLVEGEGVRDVVALNFASAKNPGGGFLGGAKAQEEDLARCSALYACQITQRAYYDANRATGSMLYTDHIIYSPDVPFFRDERLDLLERPFLLSIITAPAPNAGEAQKHGRGESARVREVLASRAGKVLSVAASMGHRTLVLGAWGCGVFRNDPRDVAGAFGDWLSHDRFRGAFDRVVFAVYDRSESAPNRRPFEARFGKQG